MATEPTAAHTVLAALAAETGQEIAARRERLAEAVTDRQYELHPDLALRFGPAGRQRCREDAVFHLSYLAEAVAIDQPALFADYVAWAQVMLAGRGIPAEDLVENLRVLGDVLARELPGGMAAVAAGVIEAGLAALPAIPDAPSAPLALLGEGPLAALARSYLDLLLAGNRQEASRRILDAARSGTAVRDLYLQVFQPCQHEIGRLWQVNRISVAQEHLCTAATQLIMSQLYPYVFAEEKTGRTLVATCVEGDLHEVGIRMVADFFEMEGWNTFYLGASTPTASLVKTLVERRADVLAVSTSRTAHVGAVARLVAAVRASEVGDRVKILVGGHPFNIAPDLCRRVGADGCARDALSAVVEAGRLLAGDGVTDLRSEPAGAWQDPALIPAPAGPAAPAAPERGEADGLHFDELSRLNNELATAQRELAKQNALLARTIEQKNQLLGIAAHDLRNPLQVIQTYSQFLLEEAKGRLGRETLEFIHTILRSSEFMATLVNGLLDLSQIEAGELAIDLAPVDLPALVAHNVQLNRVLAAKRRIAIALTSEGRGGPLLLDAPKIEQVLNNLIGNAVKFSPAGATVDVHLTVAETGAVLAVADRGPGIPAAERARLFRPFEPGRASRGNGRGNGRERGAGLGLAIVQRIVAGHRGDIRVECGEKSGTTFAVTLPRVSR
jgi:signal transduction histidine kinase